MTDKELLLSISKIIDEKIKPVQLLLENNIVPRLDNIEACYTSTYRRYEGGVNEIESFKSDISLLKDVVSEHSEKFKKIS